YHHSLRYPTLLFRHRHSQPISTLFPYTTLFRSLMHWCMEENISISFFTSSGRIRGRVIGMTNGNVTLRKTQYRKSDCEAESLHIAQHMIIGKLYNKEQLLKRTVRDHALRVDVDAITNTIEQLKKARKAVMESDDL